MRLLAAIAYGSVLMGCSAKPGSVPPKDDLHTRTLAIDVNVTGDGTPALAVRCVVKNVSSRTIHVFDSARLPYLLEDPAALVVLHGVTPPPADRDLNLIEVPTTRALGAGASFAFEVALVPLRLRSHYGDAPPSPARHGAANVVCRVGHGETAIDDVERQRASIRTLLAWQRLESSEPVRVQFP